MLAWTEGWQESLEPPPHPNSQLRWDFVKYYFQMYLHLRNTATAVQIQHWRHSAKYLPEAGENTTAALAISFPKPPGMREPCMVMVAKNEPIAPLPDQGMHTSCGYYNTGTHAALNKRRTNLALCSCFPVVNTICTQTQLFCHSIFWDAAT